MIHVCIAYRFGSTVPQEGLEIASWQVFDDEVLGMIFEADTHELDHVGMVELGHDVSLADKVDILLFCGQLLDHLNGHGDLLGTI